MIYITIPEKQRLSLPRKININPNTILQQIEKLC